MFGHLKEVKCPVGVALLHQVGHDQGWGSTPTSTAVDQGCPCLIPVNPFSHQIKEFSEWGMRLILDWDVKDLQAVPLRVDHVFQTTDVDYEGDVSAGEDTVLQSRVQTTEEQTRTHLRDRHPAEDAYLSDYVEDAESAL